MTNFSVEKNWWARVHHFSPLYDFDDAGGNAIRTPSQKFVFMGKTAAIRLVKMDLLTKEEAEHFSSSVLSSVRPGTLNGAALALAYTTFDPQSGKFLESADPHSKGEIHDYQKQRCWQTLVRRLKGDEFKSFQQDYGITAPDLLRYFLFLRRTVQPKTIGGIPNTFVLEQGDEEEFY